MLGHELAIVRELRAAQPGSVVAPFDDGIERARPGQVRSSSLRTVRTVAPNRQEHSEPNPEETEAEED